MKKLILIFALIPLMAFAQYGQRGAGGGSTFYWSLTGQAQKTDSLRIIQGTNMTITQSGNTVTFNGAAGAGSTANVRANTGWTSNGTTAQDTLATYYDINGKFQRLRIADTDGDSLILAPHALFPFAGKDGTLLLFAFDSTGRFGINAATAAQAQRAFVNVLGRATNDTLAIWSNDGGGVVGDSAWIITGAGVLSSAKATASTNILVAGSSAIGNFSTGYARFMHASQSDNGAALIQGSSGDTYLQAANGQGILFRINGTRMAELSTTGEFSAGGSFTQQAAMQVRKGATADTLFMARNDKNSTLDSTMMVFANGSGYFGGNNLYLGGHRIRSNAAGDSLIFYDGTTMIFAILSDGSTADLVAGTPPTLWRNIPPQEYIWLLRLGVLLLLLLVASKVYDYAKPRIRKHKTLPGEM